MFRFVSGGLLRRFLGASLAGAIAVSTMAAAPSTTAAATIPYHVAASVQCFPGSQGRTVQAFAPAASGMRSVTGGIETVYWRSDLYRWTGSSWALQYWNGSSWVNYAGLGDNGRYGWLDAAANGTGLLQSNGAIWNNHSQAPYGQRNNWIYAGLKSGYYKVAQYFFWSQNGALASEWSGSYNYASAAYCILS